MYEKAEPSTLSDEEYAEFYFHMGYPITKRMITIKRHRHFQRSSTRNPNTILPPITIMHISLT
jgi:hypothetical protein